MYFRTHCCAFVVVQIREISVAIGGGAVIFAVTTLLCIKFVTIVATSIVGSTMIMAAIDFFMHNSQTVHWVRVKTMHFYEMLGNVFGIFDSFAWISEIFVEFLE